MREWIRESERQSAKVEPFSREAAMELLKRDRDVKMIMQNIQESEQAITTEGQIILSSKERMILLFVSSTRLSFYGAIL